MCMNTTTVDNNKSITINNFFIIITAIVLATLTCSIYVYFAGTITLYDNTIINASYTLAFGALVCGYMAVNIGANDVANNIGPAYGAGAFSLTTALIVAAIFEAGGAFIAGGDVVKTIKKGIIDPSMFSSNIHEYIFLMVSSLLAAGIWLNIATKLGAPVSTTHSIVGAVLGGGIAAGGLDIVAWWTVLKIVGSWVASPVLGGIITAIFLWFIKRFIVYQKDQLAAAQKVIPLVIAIMTWSATTYLLLKGLKKVISLDASVAVLIGFGIATVAYLIAKPIIKKATSKIDKKSITNSVTNINWINDLFIKPLIGAACLLCFAHGANDIANAIGPYAAIYDAIINNGISKKAAIPLWIMGIGIVGLVIGLGFFGKRIIKKVGSDITELTPIRSFSIAMGSTCTVILASQLGIPVSSTHIAVGGVFAVAYFPTIIGWINKIVVILEPQGDSERSKFWENANLLENAHKKINKRKKKVNRIKKEIKETESVLDGKSAIAEPDEITKDEIIKLQDTLIHLNISLLEAKRKKGKAQEKEHEIEQRSLNLKKNMIQIASAWVLTVPGSGSLCAIIYFMTRGIALP
ncbi:inorganic phosphate transporter [Candidatus Gracilibacteria bacterium 28_42_T64]|nr:inorganic phosphate transporter [Candidatus Gracilibacteria bacterium 28_42_T64]